MLGTRYDNGMIRYVTCDVFNRVTSTDDQYLDITIQGKNFSAVLSNEYLSDRDNGPNYTYRVPISKYMSEPSVRIIFR